MNKLLFLVLALLFFGWTCAVPSYEGYIADIFPKEDPIGTVNKDEKLPVDWFPKGAKVAKSVCRLITINSFATCFLVGEENCYVMTNHHALPDEYHARLVATAQFGYEQASGYLAESYKLSPNKFFWTNKRLDISIVAVQGNPASKYGCININHKFVDYIVGQRVNLIGHHSADPKSISVRDNYIAFVEEDYICITADVAKGGSGSPTFNDNFDLMGVLRAILYNSITNKTICNEVIRIDRVIEVLVKNLSQSEQGQQVLMELGLD